MGMNQPGSGRVIGSYKRDMHESLRERREKYRMIASVVHEVQERLSDGRMSAEGALRMCDRVRRWMEINL
jgi:hypothetical protein